MFSPSFPDALQHTSDHLQALFSENQLAFPEIVSQHFSAIFAAADAFWQIPPLHPHKPPHSHANRALVRFRAMVQDTSPSPEIYLSILPSNKCGGWGLAELSDNIPALDCAKLKERTVLWAVNIPGESPWCANTFDSPPQPARLRSHSPPELTAHKYPFPDAIHTAVQVKIYDQTSAQSLKPTDILTFVGLLTSEPLPSEFTSGALVPTLHVLYQTPLPKTVILPSIPVEPPVRQQLIAWMASEALGNDYDAAEWVLLCITASVQSRSPPIFPPSLTLARYPRPPSSSAAPTLAHVFSELLPLSVALPLTLDLINNQNFSPESKNEDLHSGFLQVPAGTVLLVTESGIQEGKIMEKDGTPWSTGVRNLQALQEAIKFQTLQYQFPFSQFSFSTDLNFVVATEAKKAAFCETSIVMPLRPEPSADLFKPREDMQMPSPTILTSFRELIINAKSSKVTISEDVSQHIQNDFVQERQLDKSISPDHLVHWMTVARLMAASRGEGEITAETWALAKALDARRKARVD